MEIVRTSDVKVVVPAAGEGSRLEPLTADRPKGLVEIADRPLLAHVFETAVTAGATEIVVVVGERGHQIREEFGSRIGSVPLTYVRQPRTRGLGDAVSWAREQVDGPFMILNGDNVFGDDIGHVVERIDEPRVDGILLLEQSTRSIARETGVVHIEDGLITEIVEKPDDPPSTLITTGCYVMPPAIFDALELVRPSERQEIELSEAVGLLLEAGYTVIPVLYEGARVNVNRPEDVATAERIIRG